MSHPVENTTERQYPPCAHAYCRSAALSVSFAINRSSKPTVVVEMAEKAASGGYSWPDKLIFQLTQGEVAEVCAYFHHPWARHKWVHGRGTSLKGLSLTCQGANILVHTSTPGRDIRVPVTPRDQYFIRNLLLSRLIEIQPPLSREDHHRSLQSLASALSSQ